MDTFPTPVYYHHLDLPGGDPPHSVATVLKRKFENWHIPVFLTLSDPRGGVHDPNRSTVGYLWVFL